MMLKAGNWIVSSVHLEIWQVSWDRKKDILASIQIGDGLTQWSHRATVLVVQQHLPSAAVFSHNNLLIKLTECGQGQNHLTVTSLDSATESRAVASLCS